MTARDRRHHRVRRKCLLQDSRSVIGRPAPAAHRAVDDLETPDLAFRLKPMVKSRHKSILHKDRYRASSAGLKEGAAGAPLTTRTTFPHNVTHSAFNPPGSISFRVVLSIAALLLQSFARGSGVTPMDAPNVRQNPYCAPINMRFPESDTVIHDVTVVIDFPGPDGFGKKEATANDLMQSPTAAL